MMRCGYAGSHAAYKLSLLRNENSRGKSSALSSILLCPLTNGVHNEEVVVDGRREVLEISKNSEFLNVICLLHSGFPG